MEHPFFVFGHGWASGSPARTFQRYGLECHQLKVGDVCISLVRCADATEKISASVDNVTETVTSVSENHTHIIDTEIPVTTSLAKTALKRTHAEIQNLQICRNSNTHRRNSNSQSLNNNNNSKFENDNFSNIERAISCQNDGLENNSENGKGVSFASEAVAVHNNATVTSDAAGTRDLTNSLDDIIMGQRKIANSPTDNVVGSLTINRRGRPNLPCGTASSGLTTRKRHWSAPSEHGVQ